MNAGLAWPPLNVYRFCLICSLAFCCLPVVPSAELLQCRWFSSSRSSVSGGSRCLDFVICITARTIAFLSMLVQLETRAMSAWNRLWRVRHISVWPPRGIYIEYTRIYKKTIIRKPAVLSAKLKNHQKTCCFTSESVELAVFSRDS